MLYSHFYLYYLLTATCHTARSTLLTQAPQLSARAKAKTASIASTAPFSVPVTTTTVIIEVWLPHLLSLLNATTTTDVIAVDYCGHRYNC